MPSLRTSSSWRTFVSAAPVWFITESPTRSTRLGPSSPQAVVDTVRTTRTRRRARKVFIAPTYPDRGNPDPPICGSVLLPGVPHVVADHPVDVGEVGLVLLGDGDGLAEGLGA